MRVRNALATNMAGQQRLVLHEKFVGWECFFRGVTWFTVVICTSVHGEQRQMGASADSGLGLS